VQRVLTQIMAYHSHVIVLPVIVDLIAKYVFKNFCLLLLFMSLINVLSALTYFWCLTSLFIKLISIYNYFLNSFNAIFRKERYAGIEIEYILFKTIFKLQKMFLNVITIIVIIIVLKIFLMKSCIKQPLL